MNHSWFRISIGHCGPTDCCLVLSDDKSKKEFLVESEPWMLCGEIADTIAYRRRSAVSSEVKNTIATYPSTIYPDDPEFQDLVTLMESDTTIDERKEKIEEKNETGI